MGWFYRCRLIVERPGNVSGNEPTLKPKFISFLSNVGVKQHFPAKSFQ